MAPQAPRDPPHAGGPGGGGGEEGGEGLDLRQLVGVLRRHKYLIIGLAVLGTVLASLYVGQLTPLYRAYAQMVIERQRSNVVPMEELVRGTPMDWQTGQTESAVIASRELAKQAVERLNLRQSPLFNPELAPDRGSSGPLDYVRSAVGSAKGMLKRWLIDLGVMSEPEPRNPSAFSQRGGDAPEWRLPDVTEDAEMAYYVGAYLSGLDVSASETSRVLTVSYVSADPKFAAAAANTTAQLYIENQREEKGQMADQAVQWLDQRVAEAKQELIEAERELERFQERSGITSMRGGQSLQVEQLVRLNSQLSDARARLAEARARYQQVQGLLESEGMIESAAAVLDSELIEKLRLQEVELQRRIAELKSQYRDDHPKMVNAQAELEDLRTRIRAEVDKVAANLRNEVEVAQTRVNNLQGEISEQRQRVNEMGDAQARLRALQSEVEANRQLYETLLDRFKEISVQDERAQEADARLINRATEPGSPFYPKTRMMVIVAFLASSGLGVGLAFLLDFMESGYRRLHQLEEQTGIRALGLVPRVRLKRGEMPHQSMATSRGSYFGEAIRMLRTGLAAHVRRYGEAKVVLITSSIPGEGKTTTALSIAAQDASADRHAIVVDCDLRVSNLGRYLGQSGRLGLSDYLRGRAELREIVARDPDTGLQFIAAGTPDDYPDEILGSERMGQLIGALSQEYGRVVLDAPPVLAVADTMVLVPWADAILYAVRWGTTKRELVDAGLKRLRESDAPVIFATMTFVDMKKQSQYGGAEGYHGYGAYYGQQ